MTDRNQIIACTEGSHGLSPPTLRKVGTSRIVGRNVIAWMDNDGSYGMGGPGFFSITLDSTNRYPTERLVLTVWGAGDWLLLDGRWVNAHPNQYAIQRPLFSDFPDQKWDEVSGILIGSPLIDAQIEDDYSKLTFMGQRDSIHELEFPKDSSLLPIHAGSGEPREWNTGESLLDAWVVTRSELLC